MGELQLVETADRYARKRAVLAIVAALAFLGIQLVARPAAFAADGAPDTRVDWWAVNAIVLLGVLATGGGLLNGRRVRALVHDELSRSHLRTAVVQGYWVAMGLGLVLYLAPWFRGLTSREAVYLIVTASLVVPLLTFAWLERRALRDG
jgi:hypothetical protein